MCTNGLKLLSLIEKSIQWKHLFKYQSAIIWATLMLTPSLDKCWGLKLQWVHSSPDNTIWEQNTKVLTYSMRPYNRQITSSLEIGVIYFQKACKDYFNYGNGTVFDRNLQANNSQMGSLNDCWWLHPINDKFDIFVWKFQWIARNIYAFCLSALQLKYWQQILEL